MRVSAAGMQGMATRTPGQGPRAGDKNPMGLVYAVNDPLLSKKQNKVCTSLTLVPYARAYFNVYSH